MNRTDRINQLIALSRLGIATDDERAELDALLEDMPTFRALHGRIMNNPDMTEAYALYRSSKQADRFDLLLERKGVKRSMRHTVMIAVKYCAAVLIPLASIITYLIVKDGKKEDLYPRPFVATLKYPDLQQRTLKMSAVESYSTKELTTLPVRKEQLSNDMYLLSTSPSNEFRLTLEDGTVVHLNHGTELYFPERFDAQKRQVYLRGEAYVKVAEDTRPFLVVTDAGTIKQYGTSFNVKAYDKSQTEVVLVEGSIGVSRYDAPESEPPVMMTPGQMSVLGGTAGIVMKEVDPTPYVAWETGRFNFEDYPLSRIMEVLRKWYDIDVVFRDERLGELRFSGDIDRYGSISPVLKAIANVTGVNVELVGHQVIIGN